MPWAAARSLLKTAHWTVFRARRTLRPILVGWEEGVEAGFDVAVLFEAVLEGIQDILEGRRPVQTICSLPVP